MALLQLDEEVFEVNFLLLSVELRQRLSPKGDFFPQIYTITQYSHWEKMPLNCAVS